MFHTTPNGIVEDLNTAAEALLNVPRPYLLGQPLIVFVIREQRRLFLEKIVRFMYHASIQAQWHLIIKPVNEAAFPTVVYVSKTLGHARTLLHLTWLVRPL